MSISQISLRRGFRCTQHIGWRQARNFLEAIRYADKRLVELGRALNTFVTLNFDHIDCSPEQISARFERLRDNHFVRWLRYRKAVPAHYVWALENQGGDTHVHWVVHVPKPLREAFDSKLPEWLTRVAGTIRCAESAINIKQVSNLPGLARYLLKGMDSRYAPRYSVRHESQGLVYGKRCGVSKSLGPAYIRKARGASLKRGSIASDSGGHCGPFGGEAALGSSTSVSAIRRGPESNTDAVSPRPEA